MNSLKAIPLKEIHMRNGINVGGFQYRVYQHGPTWELHLHPVGGFVSLKHVDSRTTHYVHLATIEGCEGFVDYDAPVSTASQSGVNAAIDAANGIRSEMQGLVSNQVRVPVESDKPHAINSAEDLGSAVSPDQREAKDKHFGVKERVSTEPVNESTEPPVKKKRGRPRKVRPEEVNA